MDLGNISSFPYFQVSGTISMRYFLTCSVLKNWKSRKKERRFRTFFCLGGLSPKKVPSGARTIALMCVWRVLSIWRLEDRKLQCVLVCVWRFYFGGARIGSKQPPHSTEYPQPVREKIILDLLQIKSDYTVVYSKRY